MLIQIALLALFAICGAQLPPGVNISLLQSLFRIQYSRRIIIHIMIMMINHLLNDILVITYTIIYSIND